MPAAPIPPTERSRLCALAEYDILDTARDAVFDDLAVLAAQICEAPIALIAFVDEARVWVKAARGLALAETPRDSAFCAHAILERDGLMVVPDAAADPRFADNPLVTAAPHVRFYAGTVLRGVNFHAVGVLCVIDRRPRELSPSQLDALRRLGRQVVAQLEMRRTLARLQRHTAVHLRAAEAHRASERLHAEIVRQASGAIWAHDADGCVSMANEALLRAVGRDEAEVLGGNLRELAHPDHIAELDTYLAGIRAASTFSGLVTLRATSGAAVPLATRAFRHETGAASVVVGHGLDVSARLAAERESGRLAAVLDASPTLVALVDRAGRCTYLNGVGRELCGIGPRETVAGRSLAALHRPASACAVTDRLAHARAHGQWSGVATLRAAGGRELPMAESIVAYPGSDGMPAFYAVFALGRSIARDHASPSHDQAHVVAPAIGGELVLQERPASGADARGRLHE